MSIEGSFSLSTLLVTLISSDGSLANRLSTAERIEEEFLSTWPDKISEWAWPGLADSIPMRHLPAALLEEAYGTLLHERVHFWQSLSAPALQQHFLYGLEAYRHGATLAALEDRRIAGLSLGLEPPNPAAILQYRAFFDANFVHRSVDLDHIRGIDPVRGNPDVSLALLLEKHQGQNEFFDFPAYAALLFAGQENEDPSTRFSDTARPFAVSGKSLIESSAFVSEYMATHGVPPPDKSISTSEDEIYHGPWEIFRRAHRSRFSSEADLACAFLATVDLALLADPTPGNKGWSLEDTAVNSSVSYRFGKIVFGLSGYQLDRLHSDDDETLNGAIERFQDQFCLWFGMESPGLSLARMAVVLTNCLVQVTSMKNEDLGDKLAPWLVNSLVDPDETAQRMFEHREALRPVWDLIAEGRRASAPLFGQDLIGAMLNATIFRMDNRGVLAAPHFYADQLRELFPIPVIALDGTYCWDKAISDRLLAIGDPYPVTTMDLAHDVISLVVLEPIRTGSTDCGFNHLHERCAYQTHGLGCPKLGLTEDEMELRIAKRVDDWCHWKLRNILLSEPLAH